MQNGVITNDRMKPESKTGLSTLNSNSFKVANPASTSKGKKQYHIEMSMASGISLVTKRYLPAGNPLRMTRSSYVQMKQRQLLSVARMQLRLTSCQIMRPKESLYQTLKPRTRSLTSSNRSAHTTSIRMTIWVMIGTKLTEQVNICWKCFTSL